MDFKRITLAALVAWVVDAVYGFVVWSKLLGPRFAEFPQVFRSEVDMNARMPIMLVGGLIGIWALAAIYAKGYEGGSGVKEGFRFGLWMALFVLAFVSMGIYASFNVAANVGLMASCASALEMLVVCTAVGAVYRPAMAAQRATAPAM